MKFKPEKKVTMTDYRIGITLGKEIYTSVRKRAKLNGISISEFVRQSLIYAMHNMDRGE